MPNPYYQGPASDHFDGERFFNPGLPPSDKSLLEIVKWKLLEKRDPWPDVVPARAGIRPEQHVDGLRITHIGHASYLMQTGGHNILVDPVFGKRASPFQWAGPKRHNPPAIAVQDLPPIHIVLITHNHFDHLDMEAIGSIWQQHRPRIFSPLGNDAVVRKSLPDVHVQTGDWWSEFEMANDLRLTMVPSYHWSRRGTGDIRMALWGGFVISSAAGVIYCAGDTAYGDGVIFRDIGTRFKPPVVAMLPIGAYAPRWFMQTQHTDPNEAVQIALDCRAKQVLGIHWGTFALTDEPFDEPPKLLAAAVQERGLEAARFQALRPGDVWTAQ